MRRPFHQHTQTRRPARPLFKHSKNQTTRDWDIQTIKYVESTTWRDLESEDRDLENEDIHDRRWSSSPPPLPNLSTHICIYTHSFQIHKYRSLSTLRMKTSTTGQPLNLQPSTMTEAFWSASLPRPCRDVTSNARASASPVYARAFFVGLVLWVRLLVLYFTYIYTFIYTHLYIYIYKCIYIYI
jgi:hypothetical protein